MKKLFIPVIIIIFVFSSMLDSKVEEKKRFFLGVKAGLFISSDSDYKEIYGSSIFHPAFEFGYKALKDFFILFGFDCIRKTGTTPVLKEEAKSAQKVFSAGAGFIKALNEKFDIRIQAGGTLFSYNEEALGEEVSGSAFGFFIDGGLRYNMGEKFYTSFLLGFNSASDTANDIKLKLGGFKLALVLGVKF